MKVAVLISIATHPQSGRLIPSPLDLKACGLALSLKQYGAEVKFIHFGQASEELKDYFGYGLDSIICYPAPESFSVLNASEQLKAFDLIITGRRALSGFSAGLFAYSVADALKIGCHSNIINIVQKDNNWVFEQYLPSGFRRQISATLPAVISVHEAVQVAFHYSYQSLNQGQLIHHDEVMIDELPTADNWQFRDKKQLRKRLKVNDELSNLSGDERMKKAVGMGIQSGGSIKHLTANEAASEIWQLLLDKKIR